MDLFFEGNTGATPDAVHSGYSSAAWPAGGFTLDSELVTMTLTGVDLGIFVDPLTGMDPVLAQADFTLVATAVPEPNAALLFPFGLLVFGVAVGRTTWSA